MRKTRLLKRVLPRPLQHLSQRAFNAFAQRSTLAARVERLEFQLQELQQQLREMEAPSLLPPPASERKILEMLVEKEFAPARHALENQATNEAKINLAISQNDMMFRNVRHFASSTPAAYLRYMQIAFETVAIMEAVVKYKFGSWDEAGTILDFASGYGRTTRFLVHRVSPEQIWVSDIKARAVEFQEQHFGVNGFVSTLEPEELHVEQKFDCIFVISLFSHLSRESFARWLQRLCDVLSDTGIIAFSVHDVALLEPMGIESQGDFTYLSTSEETAFRSQDEQLRDSHYGSTFVSEKFVREVIVSLDFPSKTYARFPRSLIGKQDLYLLARDGTDLSGLSFPGN
jgi:SAM-dependent methyltransferase